MDLSDKMNSIYKRKKADEILATDLTEDEKLFVISQLYKEELNKSFPQLYYALLGWKDSHLKELRSNNAIKYLESFE